MDRYQVLNEANRLLWELKGYLGNRTLRQCRNDETQKKHFDEYAARCERIGKALSELIIEESLTGPPASNQP